MSAAHQWRRVTARDEPPSRQRCRRRRADGGASTGARSRVSARRYGADEATIVVPHGGSCARETEGPVGGGRHISGEGPRRELSRRRDRDAEEGARTAGRARAHDAASRRADMARMKPRSSFLTADRAPETRLRARAILRVSSASGGSSTSTGGRSRASRDPFRVSVRPAVRCAVTRSFDDFYFYCSHFDY